MSRSESITKAGWVVTLFFYISDMAYGQNILGGHCSVKGFYADIIDYRRMAARANNSGH